MAKHTLEQWISEALSDTDKGGPCSCLSLVQVQGMATDEVHTVKLEGKTFTAKQWAEQFHYKAEQRAANLHGTCIFQVMAFYGGSNTPSAKFPMRVEEGGNAEFFAGGGYAPTKEGFWQQAMHHVEVRHAQIMQRENAIDVAFQGLTAMLYKRVETLEASVGGLIKENLEAVGIVKAMILDKVEGEHKRVMEVKQFERATEERKRWLAFAPAIVNTIAGREIFPQSTEDTAIVEAVVDNLKIEDLPRVMGAFPPEVQGMIMDRANRRMKEKEEEAKKTKELAEASADAVAELGEGVH